MDLGECGIASADGGEVRILLLVPEACPKYVGQERPQLHHINPSLVERLRLTTRMGMLIN